MSAGYALAYRWGVTPWEHTTTRPDAAFQRLLDREEAGRPRPLGRALDLGCGTGEYTRGLQERGWDVMGVDDVRLAVDIAIRRGGESSRYVIGDVAHLPGSGVGKNFDLFLDVGCFHGLGEKDRLSMGRGVSELAAPGATLLMMCFTPRRRALAPNGADAEALASAFPGWQVVDVTEADSSEMPSWIGSKGPTWYRLKLA